LISVVTKTQLLASQLALVATFLPTFILSGFIYPIANMPVVIQLITYLIPARYFISILKSLYLKGGGIPFFWLDIIYLLIFMILMISLATRKFSKKIT
jgi:ABC-2 type transport system permease protein